VLLAAGVVSLLMLFTDGSFGPCGPSSITGLIGLLGILICFPLSGLILLGCGLRALVQRHHGGPEDLA
jgi:hypothetical protein